jgi:single stranded DNA-binding protein
MAINNRVELHGHLGADPKVIGKEDKTFLALRVATTDSYPVGQGEEVKWKDRETVWHDVLVFRPATAHFARDLKKGDRVQITGAIAYRPFTDAEGYTRRQASITASFIEKIHYEKQEELLLQGYDQAVDQALVEG